MEEVSRQKGTNDQLVLLLLQFKYITRSIYLYSNNKYCDYYDYDLLSVDL